MGSFCTDFTRLGIQRPEVLFIRLSKSKCGHLLFLNSLLMVETHVLIFWIYRTPFSILVIFIPFFTKVLKVLGYRCHSVSQTTGGGTESPFYSKFLNLALNLVVDIATIYFTINFVFISNP